MADPTDTPPPATVPPVAGGQPKSALIAFEGGGLQLRTMEEAFIFCKAVINSGLAPRDFKTPEAVLIAIQMGAEIGLAPMASLQNIAVINGKPGVYGDAGKAILRAKGFDIEELDMEEVKKGQFARCTITHPRQKPVIRTFSVEDAKTAKLWMKTGRDGQPTPWVTYPYKMLAWRAFWFAARDAAADVLKGLVGVEEHHDTPSSEPKNITPLASLAAIDAPREVAPAAAPVTVPAEVTPAAAETPAPEPPSAASPAPAPAADAPAFEGDKQTLIDLIEGLMLDLQVSEEKLVSEAIKAGHTLPKKIKKLSDIPDTTLVFMRDFLKAKKDAK